MDWSVIILLIAQFLGPILKALIDQWLLNAGNKLTRLGVEPSPEAIGRLMKEVYAQTPWFHFGKRWLVGQIARVVTRKAGEFYAAAKSGGTVACTAEDAREITES